MRHLSKKGDLKNSLVGVLAFFGIIAFFVLGIFLWNYYGSSGFALGFGAEIEGIKISEDGNSIYVRLKGGSVGREIESVRFVLTDTEGNKYFFETFEGLSDLEVPYRKSFFGGIFGREELEGFFDYELFVGEIEGLESFNGLKDISVVFNYVDEDEKKKSSNILSVRVIPSGDDVKNGSFSSGGVSGGSGTGGGSGNKGNKGSNNLVDVDDDGEGDEKDQEKIPTCTSNILIEENCLCQGIEKNSGYCCYYGWQEGSCEIFEATYYSDSSLTEDCPGDYNVTTRACGSGDKTAYNTIQKGVNVLAAGDTLAVREGVYRESVSFNVQNKINGEKDSRLKIVNYLGERVILDGSVKISDWQRCDENCLGLFDSENVINSNYSNIFRTSFEKEYITSVIDILEDEVPLQIAINPNQRDPVLEDVLSFISLNKSENIEFHEILNIGLNYLIIEDLDGIYYSLFKEGQEVVVTNKSNGNYNYNLKLINEGSYNNDGTSTLFLEDSIPSPINLDEFGVENTRFFNDYRREEAEGYWDNSMISFWSHAANNYLDKTKKIYQYNKTLGRIVFDSPLLRRVTFTESAPDAYALKNHPHLIDEPGEYIFLENHTHYDLYLWPRNEENLEENIFSPKLSNAFLFNKYGSGEDTKTFGNYLTLNGLTLKNYRGTCISSVSNSKGWQEIIIENMNLYNCAEGGGISHHLHNSRIENNNIHTMKTGYGIHVGGYNVTVVNNRINQTSGSNMWGTLKNGVIFNNTFGSAGSHGSGLVLYSGNYNVLVAYNKFYGSRLGIQHHENNTLFGNMIFRDHIVGLTNLTNTYFFNNYAETGILYHGGGGENIIAINNYAKSISPSIEQYNNIIFKEVDLADYFKSTPSVKDNTRFFNLIRNENTHSTFIPDVNYTGSIEIGSYILFENEESAQINETRYGFSGIDGTPGTHIYFNPMIGQTTAGFSVWRNLDDLEINLRHANEGLGINSGLDIGDYLPDYLQDPFFEDYLYIFNQDIEGNPRPSGIVWDIGPYEYQGETKPQSIGTGHATAPQQKRFNLIEWIRKLFAFEKI